MFELSACIDGLNRANGAEEMPEPMTGEEFDALREKHIKRLPTVH